VDQYFMLYTAVRAIHALGKQNEPGNKPKALTSIAATSLSRGTMLSPGKSGIDHPLFTISNLNGNHVRVDRYDLDVAYYS
jgi:hypothetical protein